MCTQCFQYYDKLVLLKRHQIHLEYLLKLWKVMRKWVPKGMSVHYKLHAITSLFPSHSNATLRSHETETNTCVLYFLIPNLCLGVLKTRLPHTVRAGARYGNFVDIRQTFPCMHGTTTVCCTAMSWEIYALFNAHFNSVKPTCKIRLYWSYRISGL